MTIIKNPLTIVQSGGGSLANYGTVKYLDSNNVEQTVTMANEDDFYELCVGGAGNNIYINGIAVNKNNIKGVTVADGVQYLPNNFCYGCNNLNTVTLPDTIHYIGTSVLVATSLTSPLNLANVKSIGSSFMQSSANFNQPVNLPNIEYIGSSFLNGCNNFNSLVTLNDNTRIIENNFMYGCTSFAQTFTIPSGLENLGSSYNPNTGFMRNCNSFTGPLVCNGPVNANIPTDNNTLSTTFNPQGAMYTTGVTLTGPYAQAWKDALPDRTSSPYRKLIVGS